MTMIQILRDAYADPSTVYQHLHRDFTLHVPGRNLLSGNYRGGEALRSHLARMGELTGNTIRLQAQTILADDEWGMAASRLTGERHGKRLDTIGLGLWRFKDGKLIDHWESPIDQSSYDDFFS